MPDRMPLSELAGQRGLADRLWLDEPLGKHTSFRIGGPADFFTIVEDEEQLRSWVLLAGEASLPFLVMGGGTNLLVADKGYRGLVIVNRCRSHDLDAGSCAVRAETGLPLARLARETAARGAGGLEWAVGIPGTVGGAIVNNAGAYNGEIATLVRRVRVLDRKGQPRELTADQLRLGYRSSRFKNAQASEETILSAELQLEPESASTLRARMHQYQTRRRATQPRQPSAGSVFKNPPGSSAAELIDQAGLRGKRLGGAQISEKHANYIVNAAQATAEDVLLLITMVKDQIQRRSGVDLELEIELVGEFEDRRGN